MWERKHIWVLAAHIVPNKMNTRKSTDSYKAISRFFRKNFTGQKGVGIFKGNHSELKEKLEAFQINTGQKNSSKSAFKYVKGTSSDGNVFHQETNPY